MGRKFEIPPFYRSPVVSKIKQFRHEGDHRKRDLSPSVIDVGPVRFKIARHFGFCFGVENAIEIAYRAVRENPDRRVFLLSEMIHNPHVNADLQERGVRFLLAPDGTQLVSFDELNPRDIVIVPAFGTTVELLGRLAGLGIDPQLYNATCPFVEKVWNRARYLGERGYTIIIHGKHYHEETRATFSHASISAPSVVIRDMREAKILADYIRETLPADQFARDFSSRFSDGFRVPDHLRRIGVVNQTTMLATETQEISDFLRQTMAEHYPADELAHRFADTRDTLCYATSENQDAIGGLLEAGGDLAIVVGGYNSSNTSHLGKILARRVPTFYIEDSAEMVSLAEIRHLNLQTMKVETTRDWFPRRSGPVDILLTAGASCPDALVEQVIRRLTELVGAADGLHAALRPYSSAALGATDASA